MTEHQDLSDYAKKSEIPDVSGFLTEHQDLSDYAKKSEIPDVTGFLTTESDPTVKDATITFTQGTETLGSFTANAGTDVTIDIPAAPTFVQAQADWNETDESAASFIKNKPEISATSEYNEACLSTTFCELVNTVNKLLTTVDSLKDVIANLNNNATPTVTTNTTVEFDHGQATVGGNVTNAGFGELTERGICYGTSENPTVEGSKVVATGTTTGAFTCLLSGLETDQKYYARAYATNAAGTTYGDNVEFTIYEDPQLSMVEVTVAATGTITAQANLAQEGINTITELGICWGQTEDIDPDNDGSTKVTAIALGDYTLTLEGEFTEGTYYVRAYAKTAEGVFTSAEYKTFTITVPVVASSTDHSVVDGAMQLNGTLTALGTPAATEIGVCYGPDGFPTIEAPNTKVAAATVAEGPFTVTATDMTAGTYHARAYATYAFGTVYGNDIAFTVNAPTVTTGTEPVVDNEEQKVTVSGNVTNAGSAEVTKRGICYGTTTAPDTNASKVAAGTGLGEFSATLTDLTAGVIYYARAYAVNAFGIAYGEEVTFQLEVLTPEPVVTTGEASYNTATGNITAAGEVVSAGTGGEVTERGICYGVSAEPTIEGSKVAAESTGTGEFNVTLTGLTQNTIYHLRAYATNAAGTTYGDDITVAAAYSCGDKIKDIENHEYATVKIGTQCWMQENLRVKSFIKQNGDTVHLKEWNTTNIGSGTSFYQEAHYVYGEVTKASTNITSTTDVGFSDKESEVFYPWATATTQTNSSVTNQTSTRYQGLCPTGWHIPSRDEVDILLKYVNGGTMPSNPYSNSSSSSTNQLSIRLAAENGHWRAYNASGSNATGVGTVITSGYTTDSPGEAFTNPSLKEWHWNTSNFSAYPCGYLLRANQNGSTITTAEENWVNNATLNMWVSYKSGTASGQATVCKVPVYRSSPYSQSSALGEDGYSIRCMNDNSFMSGDDNNLPAEVFTPTVNTDSAVRSGNVVTIYGNVTSDGSSSSTINRGICYGTTANPTTNQTAAGTGTGTFSVNLSGLQGGVTYYARAYATNDNGTRYGEDVTFTLPLAEVTTNTTPNISTNGIFISGEVTDGGVSAITARGICYGTAENPTIANDTVRTAAGTGTFTCSLPKTLLGNTTYHARAFATNSEGTVYGDDVDFTLPMATVTTGTAAMNGMNVDVTGNVTDTGITSITARGICWGTAAEPTTQVAAATNGAGEFTVSISGLENNVKYYLRAYATNAQGTVYGTDIEFTCTMPVPTVTTGTITIDTTNNTATIAAEITDDGGSEITARGVCWSLSENPTIDDNAVPYESADDAFTVDIENLEHTVTYYVRAYATNESGTGYGEQKTILIPFLCGIDKLVDIDDNEYNTVQIGTQCWMAENLRVKSWMNNGTKTPLAAWTYYRATNQGNTSNFCYAEISNDDTGISGIFENSTEVFYPWATVVSRTSAQTNNTASAKIQGICPDGWHVPAPAEYFTLCHYIDNETNDYLFYGERTGTSPNYYWPNCYSSSHNYSRNIDGTTPSGNTVNHPSNNQLGIKLSSRNGHWIAYADNGASSPGVGSANATSYAKDNSPGTAYHNNPDDADWHWNEFGFNAWPIGYVERKHNTTVAANAWVMNGTLNLWTSYGLGATNRAQVVKISCYESGVYTGVSGSDEAKTSYSVRCVKD